MVGSGQVKRLSLPSCLHVCAMSEPADLIVGIDAGTSVMKASPLLLRRQIASASVRNSYKSGTTVPSPNPSTRPGS